MRELIKFQSQDAIIESEYKKVNGSKIDDNGMFDAKLSVKYIKVYAKGYGQNGETYIQEHKYFRQEIIDLYNSLIKHEESESVRLSKKDLDDDLPW